MTRCCLLPLFLLLPLLALAQLVPLELDQTITLPTTSAVWDVMPHPDGYYVWVQAVPVDTDSIHISYGRSDDTLISLQQVPAPAPGHAQGLLGDRIRTLRYCGWTRLCLGPVGTRRLLKLPGLFTLER